MCQEYKNPIKSTLMINKGIICHSGTVDMGKSKHILIMVKKKKSILAFLVTPCKSSFTQHNVSESLDSSTQVAVGCSSFYWLMFLECSYSDFKSLWMQVLSSHMLLLQGLAAPNHLPLYALTVLLPSFLASVAAEN